MIDIDLKFKHIILLVLLFVCCYNIYKNKSYIQYCTLVDKINYFNNNLIKESYSFKPKDVDEYKVCKLVLNNYSHMTISAIFIDYLHELFVFTSFYNTEEDYFSEEESKFESNKYFEALCKKVKKLYNYNLMIKETENNQQSLEYYDYYYDEIIENNSNLSNFCDIETGGFYGILLIMTLMN